MPQNEQDPAANTQQFRAFAARGESKEQRPNVALIVGIVVAVLVVAGVVVLLVS